MPVVVKCITKNVLVDRPPGAENIVAASSSSSSSSSSSMDVRLPRIALLVAGYDVILLQEVGLDDVVPRLAAMLPEYDYRAHDVNKRRTNFFGNMVLWRRDAFRLLLPEKKNSTTVFVALEQLDGAPPFIVASTHLRARNNDECARTRVLQLKANLKVLASFGAPPSVVVLAGDFNDELAAGGALAQQVESAGLAVASTKATCHILHQYLPEDDDRRHEYLAIDKVCYMGGAEVIIGEIPADRPIPDADEPSDHFAVPFTLKLLTPKCEAKNAEYVV